MEIISHRGYWKYPAEKNSTAAFYRSFNLGYGTETDIRDFNNQLVISHDIPNSSALIIDVLFKLYNYIQYNYRPTLALNVKADGLHHIIKKKINQYNIQNYFFFDMSIPDLMGYKNQGLNFFVRLSEYEYPSSLLDYATGIWYDSFHKTIIDKELISSFLISHKKVCVVSPELHAREHLTIWKKIKRLPNSIIASKNFILCTDLPDDATRFFYGN